MSEIPYETIQTDYPIAGKNNSSQGFRDNFQAIHDSLGIAKAEITALETKSVLTSSLTSDNDVVINNMHGSSITNGTYFNFHGLGTTTEVAAADPTTIFDIDCTVASLFNFNLEKDCALRFINWPSNNEYAKVRVHIVSADAAPHTAVLAASDAGVLKYESTCPTSFTVSTTQKVVEAWSFDGGLNIFVRYLGEY